MEKATFCYRTGVKALEDVSFRAEKGKVSVIIGPNGSGKSTLLRLAAGLLLPENGRVRIGGRDTADLERREAARLAAFSAADAFEDAPLKVGQVMLDAAFVREGGFFADSPVLHEKVRRVAGEFELAGLLDRGMRELSSGERSRLSVARMVVQDSALMLLDEPSGRLDYRHREKLIKTLRNFALKGKAVVMVEHNLDVASRLADDVLALRDGRVAVAGPAGSVLRPSALEEVYGVHFHVVEVEGQKILFPMGASV